MFAAPSLKSMIFKTNVTRVTKKEIRNMYANKYYYLIMLILNSNIIFYRPTPFLFKTHLFCI